MQTMIGGLDAPAAIGRGSVLVAEDEPATAEVVSRYLEQAGYAIEIVSEARAAVGAAAATAHDLVVLDAQLPGLDGLEVMRRMRATDDSRPAVIMVSDDATESDRILGLRLGADDYMVKPFSPAELVARVDAVMRRMSHGPEPEGPLGSSDLEIDPISRRVLVCGAETRLTQREFDLLLFLARHPGRAFARDDLMRAVGGYSVDADSSTVTVHIRRLRAKVEADPSSPRHIKTAWGVGYRFEP